MPIAGFIFLALTPAVVFLIHCIACRLPFFRGVPTQLVAARCCAITTLIVSVGSITWSWPIAMSRISLILFCTLVSSGLCHIYFHVFNMSETARRIRILISVSMGRNVNAGQDRFAQLQMIRRRIERLVSAGAIEKIDGLYRARRSMLMMAAILMSRYERMIFPRRNSQERLGKKEAGGQFVSRVTRSRP